MPKLLFPDPLHERQFESSRRLLVYQREYLVFERIFPDYQGLHDWLAINTLLSRHAIDLLCEKGHIMCGEGIQQEFLQLDNNLAPHAA